MKRIHEIYRVMFLNDAGFRIQGAGLVFMLVSFLSVSTLQAQDVENFQPGDPFQTYLRLLQHDLNQDSVSSFLILPSSKFNIQNSVFDAHPWSDHPYFDQTPDNHFSLYTPELLRTYNSDMPFGQNDGAMWQGRGYNYAFSFGADYKYGPLEIAFRPQVGYSENRLISLAPDPPFRSWPNELSEYAMGLSRIDAPQRFGDESLTWFHPGQSYLKLNHSGFSGGISTQNLWNGPALYNPLTLSHNAPGFFHAFLGTDGPYSTPAGNIEARWFWGGLQESDYFDNDPSNNLRYITGITAAWSPSFVDGLHLGFSRTLFEYYPDNGLKGKQLFRVFQPFTEKRFALNDNTDSASALFSAFGRYVFPEVNAEIWMEWGKNENSFDRRNILKEPVDTRSYVLGFLKRFELAGHRWILFDIEHTNLENKEAEEDTLYPVWYEHHYVTQGFTHRGQVLGAGIGPGSNSLRLGVTYFERRGRAGIFAARLGHHNDRLFRHFEFIRRRQDRILKDHWNHNVPQWPNIYDLYETEYRLGGEFTAFLPYNIEVEGKLAYSFFLNRHNIYKNDINNLHTVVTFRYSLSGFSR